MFESLSTWQQIAALVAFLAVVGWCGELARQAKRSADALEAILIHLEMVDSDRPKRPIEYP